jgi:hypothetical protein
MMAAFSISNFRFPISTASARAAAPCPCQWEIGNRESETNDLKGIGATGDAPARAIRLAAAVLAALLAAGCRTDQREDPQRLVLKGAAVQPPAAERPLYRIQVARLLHRLRPDAEVESVWDVLRTAAAPHEKQALWEANDLRLGEGGAEATERLRGLLASTPDRQVHVHTILVRENFEFRVSFGPKRQTLDLLWTDAEGRLVGRQFGRAAAEVRMVCRRDPRRPGAVRVALVPEVAYGDEQFRWTETPEGFSRRMGQSRLVLSDLASEVPLGAGRLLVLGGARSGPLSLGGAYFYEQRGPDLWVHTAVFAVQPASPP